MKNTYVYTCLLLSSMLPVSSSAGEDIAAHAHAVTEPIETQAYLPPSESDIPDNEFGKMVRLGRNVFVNTGEYAKEYVGNELSCSNCHLDAGRLANSSPLWAAWVSYPAYRGKNKMVNTMEERLQGCFKYSMNGTPPPSDSDVLKSLMSYSFWLANGAPTNVDLPGRGYPEIDKPEQQPDIDRGRSLFNSKCAVCHGDIGQGTKTGNKYAFPPLWGNKSFNWGAGMHRVNTAASFIRANMPLGKGGSLSVQEAWDIAYYMNSHERPQDPRFNGDLIKTDQEFHSHQCRYGDKLDGHVLGQKTR